MISLLVTTEIAEQISSIIVGDTLHHDIIAASTAVPNLFFYMTIESWEL
jgi:hypothetical protein